MLTRQRVPDPEISATDGPFLLRTAHKAAIRIAAPEGTRCAQRAGRRPDVGPNSGAQADGGGWAALWPHAGRPGPPYLSQRQQDTHEVLGSGIRGCWGGWWKETAPQCGSSISLSGKAGALVSVLGSHLYNMQSGSNQNGPVPQLCRRIRTVTQRGWPGLDDLEGPSTT